MTKHVETKVYTKYFTKIPLMSKVMLKDFHILSMFFFFLLLKTCNSITMVPIDMKLGI